MENLAAVMKASFQVYHTFAPAIVIPCLISLAIGRQGTHKKEVR